ncbi:MAG: tRNA (adenosine(37)-N6)-threonylcarbamoyltransferase complex dimerization subunit type 1 TsaB [Bacteroidales bacterium]|nr:tRNA (adenosine(37)-N6)-threonylcarbamoyltransferase complex dimerization subunit type 1 TsaB [Bacteroidales bacterium]
MDCRIILLETSTSLCSVALLEGDRITACRMSDSPRAHASQTAPFVQEVLEERGLRVSDCDAVCLSMGPGSYTGLRVGSSTAKGLCFGGGIPLLAVSTLDVLVAQALQEGLPKGYEFIVPMIDARRMEVYTAIYSADGQRLTEIEPIVVEGWGSLRSLRSVEMTGMGSGSVGMTEGSIPGVEPAASAVISSGGREEFSPVISSGGREVFSPVISSGGREESSPVISSGGVAGVEKSPGVLFIGDGVAKCEAVLARPGATFLQEYPRADAMKAPALREFAAGAFRDIAYFEPFYLKDFVATVGKKLF